MQLSLKHIIPDIARNAILEEFDKSIGYNLQALTDEYPVLKNEEASFVTLLIEKNGRKELRGCIGSIAPQTDLISDIRKNAKAAAFNDPRFNPLEIDEFDKISLEVSILSKPQKLDCKGIDELRAHIIPEYHGVIIVKNAKKAVFLPSVWEKLPDFDDFFAHLCKKAGLSEDCIGSIDEVYSFIVQKYAEDGSD